MLRPVHPGRFAWNEIVEAHGLSVTEAARILRVSRPALSSLLNARADLSGDMALRFEKAFGVRYGDPYADAEFLRYCSDAGAGEEDSRGSL